MKKLFLIFSLFIIHFSLFAQADSIAFKKIDSIVHKAPIAAINDFEGVFAPSEKQQLDSLVKSVEKELKTEVVVLTLDSLPVKEVDFDNTALLLANGWRIGATYEERGIVIVISKHLRRIRIQNSYGIEPVISDTQTKAVIDSTMIPEFKQGNYFVGMQNGIIALSNLIRTYNTNVGKEGK